MTKPKLKIRDVIYLSIIVLLTVTVAILSVLLLKPEEERSFFEEYYDTKCESFGVQNSNLAKGQIVFIGDSITDLYSLDDYYSDLPLAAYNRGIGGDVTGGVLRRLDVSIFDIKPSKIVLMIGTNNVNAGHSEVDIIADYAAILDKINEELPYAEIYCMSIIPQNEKLEEYSTVKVSETTEVIKRINPEIKRLAEERCATYIDLFPHLADDNDRLIEDYSDDGLHLNAEGYKIWTAQLKPYLG